jgi:hypothetical protein
VIEEYGVSCVDLRTDQDGVLVVAGHQDGTVGVTRVLAVGQNDGITPLWQYRLHSGTVTTALFDDSDQIITGSADRSVCIMPVADTQAGTGEPHIQRLYLSLRCQNVQFAGVRTEREQEKLRKHSST